MAPSLLVTGIGELTLNAPDSAVDPRDPQAVDRRPRESRPEPYQHAAFLV